MKFWTKLSLPFYFLLVFSVGVSAQQEGTRTLSLSQNWPTDLTVTVSIAINGEAGDALVLETPPQGWAVSAITTKGVLADGIITWNTSVRRAGLQQLVKYTLTLPNAEASGVFQGTVNDRSIGGVQSLSAQGITPGVQTPIRSGLYYNYMVYLPPSYQPTGQPMPLLFFLHGAGERGTDMSLLKVHGPPKIVEDPSSMTKLFGAQEFPFIGIAPQCPANWWWENQHVMEVLEEVLQNYLIDRSRIYFTGISMGGFGTWSFASEHPDLLAAILPIAGGGDVFKFSINSFTTHKENLKAANPETLVDMPIWSFHGNSDTTVSIKLDQEIVDQVNALGGNAQLTVYPGVGHDSWTQTYLNPEVYTWLLSHSKDSIDTQVSDWSLYR